MSGCPHGAEHVGVGDRAPLHGGRRTALGAHCPRRGDARRLDLAVALVPGAVDRRDHRLLHAAGPRRADPARAQASCGSAAARGRDAVLGGDTGEPVRHARSAVRSITLSPSSRVRSNATPEAERITTTAGQSSPSAARRAPTSAKSIGRPSASPTPPPTPRAARRGGRKGKVAVRPEFTARLRLPGGAPRRVETTHSIRSAGYVQPGDLRDPRLTPLDPELEGSRRDERQTLDAVHRPARGPVHRLPGWPLPGLPGGRGQTLRALTGGINAAETSHRDSMFPARAGMNCARTGRASPGAGVPRQRTDEPRARAARAARAHRPL